MKEILTKKNEVILVDDNVYKWASKIKWHTNNGYAKNTKLGKLHNLILEKGDFFIDHKNRNRLDNRISNLRLATNSDNNVNRTYKTGVSGFRGVKKKKGRNNWEVNIQKNNKKIYVGVFDTPEKAAEAYNKKAIELFGDYAIINNL